MQSTTTSKDDTGRPRDKEIGMFRNFTNRIAGRSVRKFAPLVAAVAVVAGIAGGTAADASAQPTYWNVPGQSFLAHAELMVDCHTVNNYNGTKTWIVTASARKAYTNASVAVEFIRVDNGLPAAAAGWNYAGWNYVENVNYRWEQTVNLTAATKTVRFVAHFALYDYGWVISPTGGALVPANHTNHTWYGGYGVGYDQRHGGLSNCVLT